MFKFLELIQKEFDTLAKLLSSEHGKTIPDARGDIQRGVEVVEFACGIPHLLKGEFTEGAGPASTSIRSASRSASSPASRRSISGDDSDVEIRSRNRVRKRVHPQAVRTRSVCSDASCRTHGRSGLAAGILNVVNGDKEAVDTLLTDPRVMADRLSSVRQILRNTSTHRLRQRQTRPVLWRRKEHMIVMPDATWIRRVTRSSAQATALPASAAWRCRWRSRSARKQPTSRRKADSARREPEDRSFQRSAGDYGPMVTRRI
jgi:malonate-semialdehyde dehydrogenase (acetylating)/methylmalonate-semialdehyde dehydrogenase